MRANLGAPPPTHGIGVEEWKARCELARERGGREGPVCPRCDRQAGHPRFLNPNYERTYDKCQVCGGDSGFVWAARRPFARVTR